MLTFSGYPTTLTATAALLVTVACSGPVEPKRVTLPMSTDGAGLGAVTNDLGYTVQLTSAALVADDLKFTITGEAHSSLFRRLSDGVMPVAHAHPGHYQGGEVTGEMPGHFVLRFAPGETELLGEATLLSGQYHSINMTLALATADDVTAQDPLLGHTAVLIGSASKGGQDVRFQAAIDSPLARELVGIPFDEQVAQSDRALVLRLMTLDPREQDTLLDGIDFVLLDDDGDGEVMIGPEATGADAVSAYNHLRRTLQTHDHFVVEQGPR